MFHSPRLNDSDHYHVNVHFSTPCPIDSQHLNCITGCADWEGFSQLFAFEDICKLHCGLFHECCSLSCYPSHPPIIIKTFLGGCSMKGRSASWHHLCSEKSSLILLSAPDTDLDIQITLFQSTCEAKWTSWGGLLSLVFPCLMLLDVMWNILRHISCKCNWTSVPVIFVGSAIITSQADITSLLASTFSFVCILENYEFVKVMQNHYP
jgi:hypothetical protein